MSSIQLQNVSLSYGGPAVLESIDLQIQAGEFVGILGPNGAGKSSLLRVLAGLRLPHIGSVCIDGREIASLSPKERAKKIALVPQWTVMAFSFTVLDVVLMGRHPHLGRMAFETEKDLAIVIEAMEKTDTLKFRDRAFGELSGGEMQRVVVARAIAQTAPIMLLDEPTSSLDLQHQQRIYGILQQLNRSGTTVIVTTHDLNLASQYCRRILLLDRGKLTADGSPEAVLTEKRLEETYGARIERIQRDGRLFFMPGSTKEARR